MVSLHKLKNYANLLSYICNRKVFKREQNILRVILLRTEITQRISWSVDTLISSGNERNDQDCTTSEKANVSFIIYFFN